MPPNRYRSAEINNPRRMTCHDFRGFASTVLHEQGYDHDHINIQRAEGLADARLGRLLGAEATRRVTLCRSLRDCGLDSRQLQPGVSSQFVFFVASERFVLDMNCQLGIRDLADINAIGREVNGVKRCGIAAAGRFYQRPSLLTGAGDSRQVEGELLWSIRKVARYHHCRLPFDLPRPRRGPCRLPVFPASRSCRSGLPGFARRRAMSCLYQFNIESSSATSVCTL